MAVFFSDARCRSGAQEEDSRRVGESFVSVEAFPREGPTVQRILLVLCVGASIPNDCDGVLLTCSFRHRRSP